MKGQQIAIKPPEWRRPRHFTVVAWSDQYIGRSPPLCGRSATTVFLWLTNELFTVWRPVVWRRPCHDSPSLPSQHSRLEWWSPSKSQLQEQRRWHRTMHRPWRRPLLWEGGTNWTNQPYCFSRTSIRLLFRLARCLIVVVISPSSFRFVVLVCVGSERRSKMKFESWSEFEIGIRLESEFFRNLRNK